MRKISILFLLMISANVINAQEYLWPTNASHYLTSSFAEYRPGHFHAGIDIKTWGKNGYKVFAVRDGYISRIQMSPFGYGKVIYQKLDTGEYVIYAHLDRFNERITALAKKEQKRKSEYRINKYFKANQVPVKKGEIIGYTGCSGIGPPHLHFEMRDSKNCPINPFLMGYKVQDTRKPILKAICISPLDINSKVESDVVPWITKPDLVKSGVYQLSNIPLLHGKIGFAIDCFDQADGVNNVFAVYKIDFYVDGELKFSVTYDKFSYAESHFIDLDRDYRLRKRGIGIFQKLYKEKDNQLSFYRPYGNEIGILNCQQEMADNANSGNSLSTGQHHFQIELYDFFGNVSYCSGDFIVGERKKIYANFQNDEMDQIVVSSLIFQNGTDIVDPEFFVSTDEGRSWRKHAANVIEKHLGEGPAASKNYILSVNRPKYIIKIVTKDEYGIESYPLYQVIDNNKSDVSTIANLELTKDFYDDFVRLSISADGILTETPQIFVQQIGLPTTKIQLFQNEFNQYFGIYQFVPEKNGPVSIEANALDDAGRELVYWDQFDIETVSPHRGGMIASKDGNCWIIFRKDAVYRNLFLRVTDNGPLNDDKYDFVGEVYEGNPQDVLLKESALIELKYPENDPQPDKLGIYSVGGSRPGFIGNKLNTEGKFISANVSSLGSYTIIRDVDPPIISIKKPGHNTQVHDRTPLLVASVYDELSGISNERSIVMKLNGHEVIAEYDPDAKTITYVPDVALSAGKHILEVWAKDNSDNEQERSIHFNILP